MFKKWYYVAIFVPLIIICGIIIWYKQSVNRADGEIKVGILHSLSGPMAAAEKYIVDTTLMAIDEINQEGGLLGKKIVPIIADGKSDSDVFAKESERLITKEKVVALFGGGVSSTRKKIKDEVEKYNSLLFYPHRYEGLESSANIVYTGATANQQIVPGLIWCMQNFGKNFFLVGNHLSKENYITEMATRQIIKDLIFAYDGHLVGEESVDLESKDIDSIVKNIYMKQPDVIINILEGEVNSVFFKAMRGQWLTEKIPTISINVTEVELTVFNIDQMVGDYAVQSYFQSLDTEENVSFVERFKKRYGADRVISNPMENAYISVYFWRNAVERAQTTEINEVRKHLRELTFSAPEGVISVDKKNQHTWKPVLIGKIFPSKQFGIVWNSNSTTRPLPYPPFRTKEQWQQLLDQWSTASAGK